MNETDVPNATELAKKADMSYKTVNDIVNGNNKNPQISTVAKMLNCMGYELTYKRA